MKLKGLRFEGAANEIDQVDVNQDADGGDATDDEDGEVAGRPAVATRPDTVDADSDTASSRASTTIYDGSQNGDDVVGVEQEEGAEEEETGLELSTDDLLSHRALLISCIAPPLTYCLSSVRHYHLQHYLRRTVQESSCRGFVGQWLLAVFCYDTRAGKEDAVELYWRGLCQGIRLWTSLASPE